MNSLSYKLLIRDTDNEKSGKFQNRWDLISLRIVLKDS